MRDKCFDEGMIQAFFDGELESNLLEQVARHVSDCDPCAVMMSEIEAESASVAAAFEIENFELVPTERLRTKIFAGIAEYENGGSSWLGKAVAALGFSNSLRGFRWTSPSVAAFASLVLVAGVVAMLLVSKPDVSNKPVAQISPKAQPADSSTGRTDVSTPVEPADPDVTEPAQKINRVNLPEDRQKEYKIVKTGGLAVDVKPVTADSLPVDGEERYLQTIRTLKTSVDIRKGDTLKPSALVAYERDMAVIDDAISKMQRAARKNPKDEAAKQVLFSSYQNKIDLLSAVSDKTELMASLR
jgi:hypothetical protein